MFGGSIWVAVFLCVALSTASDTISTTYWEQPHVLWLVLVLLLSPLCFLAFGYVGAKFGLSIASSITNSLIALGPILYGLVIRAEWRRVTTPQYLGMLCIVGGIALVTIFKEGVTE
jgi:hypothetical protein